MIRNDAAVTSALIDRQLSRKPHRVELARWEGRICADCGRTLADGEPVWVWRHGYAVGGWRRERSAPHCADCGRREAEARWDKPFRATTCAGCGRVMHRQPDWLLRRFDVCSERCWATAHNAARRAARLEARSRRCLGCGAAFTARRDARYCSPACRQRAYRQRQTS